MIITVRAMELDDLEAVHTILNGPNVIAGTLQIPYRSMEDRRQREKSRPADSHRLVAEIDGLVIASASLSVSSNPRMRHSGSIGMGVHDDYQGQGAGTALMTAIVDLADNWLNLRRLDLQVYTDNAAAIHLYEKFGFVIEGTLRDFAFRAGQYADAYAMARLRIPSP